MYLDDTRNPDYDPNTPGSGKLQGDHGAMTRAQAIRKGLPIPLPDRLLHRRCNQQRGDGINDHLAAANNHKPAQPTQTTEHLHMTWPW